MGTATRERLFEIEGHGHGVERERPQQVAAHAGFHLDQGAGSVVDPLDAHALGEAGELGFNIDIPNQPRSSGNDEEQVLNQAAEGAQQIEGFSWPSAPARYFSVD